MIPPKPHIQGCTMRPYIRRPHRGFPLLIRSQAPVDDGVKKVSHQSIVQMKHLASLFQKADCPLANYPHDEELGLFFQCLLPGEQVQRVTFGLSTSVRRRTPPGPSCRGAVSRRLRRVGAAEGGVQGAGEVVGLGRDVTNGQILGGWFTTQCNVILNPKGPQVCFSVICTEHCRLNNIWIKMACYPRWRPNNIQV